MEVGRKVNMSNTITLDSSVVRPGAWLRFKARVPWAFRHMFTMIERRLYQRRGVFVWLDDHRIRCAIDAAPVFVNQPDHVEERMLMQRVFDSLSPGDCFLDVGSHVGLYAIGAALRLGRGGRVIAFEPTPATIVKLQKNIELNRLNDRIEIHEVALSDVCGSTEFVTTGTSMLNSIFAGAPAGHTRLGGPERRFQVRTAPLDQFLDPARSHVAKIDTEGHELFVLKGAERLLASKARIFLELHPWAWESTDGTWSELTQLCRRHRRVMRTVGGTRLTEPAHCRVELVRERV
jgi:FkbM family methyltransferase